MGIDSKFMDITRKAIGVDLANIMNKVIILLFIKNLYNKDMLKKYGDLVYNEEQEIGEINQIVDISKDIGGTGKIKQSHKIVLSRTNKIILLETLLEVWQVWPFT